MIPENRSWVWPNTLGSLGVCLVKLRVWGGGNKAFSPGA